MLQAALEYRLDVVAFGLLATAGMLAVHVWLRRARGTRGAGPIAWGALLLIIAAVAQRAEQVGDWERATLREGMQAFARTYAQELQRMGHASVRWDTPADDPLYVQMVQSQVRWLEASPAVNDVYTFRRQLDGKIAFVVDSETDYDSDGDYVDEREARTPIGEVYPEADENMARALAGEEKFDATPVTDRWGTWVNAYVPLYDPATGRVEAGLGVDYDASHWAQRILSRRRVPLVGGSTLVMLLMGWTGSVGALKAEMARRAQVEAALRRSEERFRLVAECGSDILYEWDIARERLQWFGKIDRELGYDEGSFPRTMQAWEQAIHPDDRDRVVQALGRHVARDVPFREAYRVVTADGSVRHWFDRGVVLRDPEGKPVSMVGAVTDVTDQKRAAVLEAERQALRKAVASMEQVLGVVGHELRTPLAGVRAISELLLLQGEAEGVDGRNGGAPSRQQMLASLNDQVVRMADTVNDLLEAARLNSGMAKWNWSQFNLRDVCEEAMETVRPLVDAVAVELSIEPAPEAAGLTMNGDANAVRRLVLNLLNNALKHTRHGFVRVSARAVAADVDWVEVTVSDSGEGIPPEIRARLGHAFALNAGIVGDNHVRGTGLGLAICKGIAAAHGGQIEIHSDVGRGTIVTVKLRADLESPSTDPGAIRVTDTARPLSVAESAAA